MKIVYNNANKATGISAVSLMTELGKFTGFAKCAPSDMKHFSKISGCMYAENRAYIKYAKAKIKWLKSKQKAIITFTDSIRRSKALTRDDILRKLYRTINVYEKEIANWNDKIKNKENEIIEDIKKIDDYYLNKDKKSNELEKDRPSKTTDS